MPDLIKEISIKQAEGSGYDTREIGADATNIEVGLDANGKVIDSGVAASTTNAASVLKAHETTMNGLDTGKAAKNHASTGTDFGVAASDKYGHMKVGTGLEATNGVVAVKYGVAAGTAAQGNDARLSDARTPLAHAADAATTYGAGSSSKFGHTKLSNTYNNDAPSAATNGADKSIGASAFALEQAYKIMKRNIVEYRNITADFDNGTFSANPENYSPGNYIVKTYDGTTYVAVLAHYNYWYNPGRNDYANINVNHWAAIVMGFGAGQMNPLVDGANTTAGGFKNSAMMTWLKGDAKTAVLGAFANTHVKSHSCLLSTGTYDATKAPNYGFSWDWENDVYAMIPSLAQLGCNSQMSFDRYGQGEACRPLKLFQEKSFMEVLSRNYGQSNNNFNSNSAWCRDIASTSPGAHFCLANYVGFANNGIASASFGRFPLIILV